MADAPATDTEADSGGYLAICLMIGVIANVALLTLALLISIP